MKLLSLWRGPLLLLLYQGIPAGVRPDSLGRYRLTFSLGGGQWEKADFSCDGALLSTTPVRFRSTGIELEAWHDNRVRLIAFVGKTGQRNGPSRVTDPNSGAPYVPFYAGTYGGGGFAYEGRAIGAGVGIIAVPGPDGFLAPTPYLRLGSRDAGHLRLEVFGPTPAFPTAGWVRLGAGFNKGHRRGYSGFIGVATGPVDYNSRLAFTGELGIPIARRLSGHLYGLAGSGNGVAQWNTGVALRLDLGRPPTPPRQMSMRRG